MSKTRAELIKVGAQWGAYLWLTDKHGQSSRTIVAVGNTPDEARTNALSFTRGQHEIALKRLVKAQADSVALREMCEAFEAVAELAITLETVQKKVDEYDPRRPSSLGGKREA